MKRTIAVIAAVIAGAVALPGAASAQNCNVGGCNIVATGAGSGTTVKARTPWIDYPWTVDDAQLHSDYDGAFWFQSGGPVGWFDMYAAPWHGANEIECFALHPGASTNIWLYVRAPAGRKFSCHVHVR